MDPKANSTTVSYSELGFARLTHFLLHKKIEAIFLGFYVKKKFLFVLVRNFKNLEKIFCFPKNYFLEEICLNCLLRILLNKSHFSA